MIDAVILAAGLSRRMEDVNKLLLPFRGQSIIERVTDQIAAANVNHIIVVLGNESDRIKEALERFNVEFVYNTDYMSGQTSSIQSAMPFITSLADGFMICLGDMPLLDTDHYELIIRDFHNKLKVFSTPIVRPVMNDRVGHPIIFHRSYVQDVLACKSTDGCRDVVKKYKDHFMPIQVETMSYFYDVDNHEDYRRLNLTSEE